jgi:hypothetical protein
MRRHIPTVQNRGQAVPVFSASKQQVDRADYSLFIGSIGSWFKPEILKELDEEGIPIQVSEQFYVDGDTKASLKQRLAALCQAEDARLTDFERDWIAGAL